MKLRSQSPSQEQQQKEGAKGTEKQNKRLKRDSNTVKKKRTDENANEETTLKRSPMRSDVVHVVTDRSLGNNSWSRLEKVCSTPLLGSLSSLRIHKSASPFDRRVMSLAWFPQTPNKLAIGSKSGSIWIWDLNNENNSKIITRPDCVPGDAINSMKFHRVRQNLLLIGCGDGTFSYEDVETTARFVYEKNFPRQFTTWFCSVESSLDGKLVLGGDNHGGVAIYSDEGQKIRWMRLHKTKVTHIEFNAKDEWLLATSSVDRTVKMWDIRKLETRENCLQSFDHEAGVNNATFNPRDGTRMLTTDQGGQIRVYSGPLWTLSQTISHPHRQFQHLTPIKANWHPLDDIIVVGRYPNPKSPDYVKGDLRTIDFFGAQFGNELLRLSDCDMTGIVSLNDFNLTGDMMASAMGYNVMVWKPKSKILTDEGHENTDKVQARRENGGGGGGGGGGSKTKHGNKPESYFRVPTSKKKKQT